MTNAIINYSFTIERNVGMEDVLTIYDKYGAVVYIATVQEEIALASEEEQIEYIESTYPDLIENLIKGEY